METGGTQEKGQDGRADEVGKVVRIPRDWFGPREELVPFGPAASDSAAADGEPPGVPLDPNRFWDESSGSIQGVVEAPPRPAASSIDGEPFGHRGARAVHALRQAIGRREAAVVAVVALVGVLGAFGWVLARSQRQASKATVAAITRGRASTLQRPPVRRLSRRASVRSTTHATSKKHVKAPARHISTTQFVSHASQPAPAQQTSYETAASQTSPATGSSSSNTTSGATTSSESTPSQSSTPAFGASGALGPMSSPDG